MTRAAALLFLLFLAAGGCGRHHGSFDAARALAEEAGRRLAPVGPAERRGYLERARIFEPVTRPRDPLVGPPDRFSYAFGDTASCDFIEPRAERVPTGGTTKKFFCALRHGRAHADVKIKYGTDNPEIFGEVLGSRLLWALGVAADHDYPVAVRCHGCPVEPWLAYRDYPRRDVTERAVRTFDDAVLQRLYPGVPIEEHHDQGWGFAELGHGAEADALRVIAAFMAHGDDKPENHRMVCPFDAIDATGRCREPRLLLADLGSTFGRGGSRVLGLIDRDARPRYALWSTLPMWQDAAACRLHWATRVGPPHPVVGEAGRQLAAERLAALSDGQIRELFVVARIEALGEVYDVDGRGPRRVTVDDWAAAFQRRRREILDTRCPR